MNELEIIDDKKIENMIYEVRGVQVILDSDIAKLYNVETKYLNRQVKRNQNRFPEDFCFQLTEEEYNNLRCQNVTSSLEEDNYGGRRYLPYVFTEHGTIALSGVLKSETAAEESVNISRTFVRMRHYIKYNEKMLPNRVLLLEEKTDKHDKMLEELFNMFKSDDIVKDKLFFKGEFYDAYSLLIDILDSSKEEIIIVDNYIDKTLLDILKSINKKIIIITKNISKTLKEKYEKQYHNITFIRNDNFHDRFIILDKEKLYNCGASLKDLGKKCFYIGEIEEKELIENMQNRIEKIISNK